MRGLVTRMHIGAIALLLAGAMVAAARPVSREIPERLSDDAFWQMITTMSEPGGYFRSDNLVSNELTFQHVVPELQRTLGTGGVYLGVGPDQNFTYLVALRPRIAFIVDIRRGNLLQHLMYKALIELAPDRAAFLSYLFSRPRPASLDTASSVTALMSAYDSVAADSVQLRRTLELVRKRLVDQHHFPLTAADLAGIEYVMLAFFDGGPSLTYSFGRGGGYYGGPRGMPSYSDLMVETDDDGVARGYLASELLFRSLKSLQQNNLVVPIVGDFGGDKALRAVGEYLTTHRATVSAIYTSNVEQYLFQSDDAWRRYYANVATLPLDDKSVFVRAVFNYGGYRDPGMPRGPRSVTMLSSVRELVAGAAVGTVQSYWDVIQLSRSPVETVNR